MTSIKSGSTGLLLLFGGLSLAAVAIGALVCAQSGAPPGLWARNLATWLVGALAAAGLAAGIGPRVLPFVLWAAPLALGATFLGAGHDGVHRWIQAGPLNINVAQLVLPTAVVALAVLSNTARSAWLPALACLGILAWQPDASQATAFALAVVLVAVGCAATRPVKVAVALVSAALAAVAWLRPDPLQPVPEVEDVIELAAAQSPVLAVLAVAVLAALALAPAFGARRSSPDLLTAGAALTGLFALWAATPFLGHFPVPWVGLGPSAVLGAWLGVGLLAALMRRAAAAERP